MRQPRTSVVFTETRLFRFPSDVKPVVTYGTLDVSLVNVFNPNSPYYYPLAEARERWAQDAMLGKVQP